MMILLLLVCSLVPMAVGLALLVTAPPEPREPEPAELTLSRPVVRPLAVRARAMAARARRVALRLRTRSPRRVRGPVVFAGAEVSAARTLFAGKIPELWSLSDSHRPLPCR
ncbi:MAG: hypothetical protein JNL82_15445 [Myxococcales bacterium]|nr:hypothetical protein [Myxococcales bacterium]